MYRKNQLLKEKRNTDIQATENGNGIFCSNNIDHDGAKDVDDVDVDSTNGHPNDGNDVTNIKFDDKIQQCNFEGYQLKPACIKSFEFSSALTCIIKLLFGRFSELLRRIVVVACIFQHWLYYVIMPCDPTSVHYSPSFKSAINALLAVENGFWAVSLLFPKVKSVALNRLIKWTQSTCSHILSFYLSFDHLLMSCIYENLKLWSQTPGQLRASWEKTSTDPIISLCLQSVNGISSGSVLMKRIDVNNRSVLLFYRPEIQYKKNHITIWIPGGGFHALGPNDFLGVGSYLCYCAPVLIFDYPKSPEDPYPVALHWIYNTINLLFEKNQGEDISEILYSNSNIKTDIQKNWNVVFAGDSAGGNLATVLATKLSHDSFSSVTVVGLALVYPLLSFEINGWLSSDDQKIRESVAPHLVGGSASGGPNRSRFAIPSRLLNLNDKIIRTDILCYLAQSYLSLTNNSITTADRFVIGQNDTYLSSKQINPSDPSLTPLKLPNEMIQTIPQLFIQLGEMDPFLDDSLILFHKALNESDTICCSYKTESDMTFTTITGSNSRHVTLSLIEGVSHGYLQMQLLWNGFKPCLLEIQTAIQAMFDNGSV